MKHKLYFIIVLSVALGVISAFEGPDISTWMASSAFSLMDQESKTLQLDVLAFFYTISILDPLTFPATPMPELLSRFIPSSFFAFDGTLSIRLFYVQIALLLRRIAICVLAKRIQPPPSLNCAWMVILWVSLVSWLIGILVTLIPILAAPTFVGIDVHKEIGFASGS